MDFWGEPAVNILAWGQFFTLCRVCRCHWGVWTFCYSSAHVSTVHTSYWGGSRCEIWVGSLEGWVIPCSRGDRVGWATGFPQLPLSVIAVPLSSPLSLVVVEGPGRPPAGKPLQLCDDTEPLLLSDTWVVRGPVVGSAFSSPLLLSFELDVFLGRDSGSLGVAGDGVVSGEVAATVAVVAMSEKAGASSWGTSTVKGSLASEPGTVEYAATEPSLLKKRWSPSKFLVSRRSWNCRFLKSGWWFGMFTGDTVVIDWTSPSKSGVTESLCSPSVLLPKLLLPPAPEDEEEEESRHVLQPEQ